MRQRSEIFFLHLKKIRTKIVFEEKFKYYQTYFHKNKIR